MTDRVAILSKIGHDLRHWLGHLDLHADGLVTRPSDNDLASLSAEGMPGPAAAKLYAKVRAGGEAALAKRALRYGAGSAGLAELDRYWRTGHL